MPAAGPRCGRGATWGLAVCACLWVGAVPAAEAPPGAELATLIDQEIAATAAGVVPAGRAADGELLRRIRLDLTGTLPTLDEAAAYLDDSAPDKYARLVERLLASPEYAKRLRDAFHTMWLERRKDDPAWGAFLEKAFATDLPFDKLCRAILYPLDGDKETAGSELFFAARLENYGQNPVDHPALTRDVGRLFLGKDLQCAQCHNHLFVEDYRQADFQGLFTVIQGLSRNTKKGPPIVEKPVLGPLEFVSVFEPTKFRTLPRVPGRTEIELPPLKPGEEYRVPPDKKLGTPGELKFSAWQRLADDIVAPDHEQFAANAVNRIWFLLLGRGLVHPLDLHHAGNPPSHPELMRRLAADFTMHGCDVRRLIRGIVLSETYCRAGRLPGKRPPPEKFASALEKRLSSEQWFASAWTALGGEAPAPGTEFRTLQPGLWAKVHKAFDAPAGEPETEFVPSLSGVLLVMNDPDLLARLEPQPGRTTFKAREAATVEAGLDVLYLAILTRRPTEVERREGVALLAPLAGAERDAAWVDLAWALLGSAEFAVNH